MQIRCQIYEFATPPMLMGSFAKNKQKCLKLYPQISQRILGLFQNQRHILEANNQDYNCCKYEEDWLSLKKTETLLPNKNLTMCHDQ